MTALASIYNLQPLVSERNVDFLQQSIQQQLPKVPRISHASHRVIQLLIAAHNKSVQKYEQIEIKLPSIYKDLHAFNECALRCLQAEKEHEEVIKQVQRPKSLSEKSILLIGISSVAYVLNSDTTTWGRAAGFVISAAVGLFIAMDDPAINKSRAKVTDTHTKLADAKIRLQEQADAFVQENTTNKKAYTILTTELNKKISAHSGNKNSIEYQTYSSVLQELNSCMEYCFTG